MATEVRFAFALNGGVSLAIWIGGVGDEVLRFIDGGRRAANGEHDDGNPYIALCRELDLLPKVDVLVGSSAGGLNAAFLGCAVAQGSPNLEPIRSLWLNHGAFDRLLRAHTDSSLISLLNGDDNFLPHIEEAFRLIARSGTGFTLVDPPITVRLTATSLAGRVTVISDGHGQIASVDHRAEFVFTTRDFDVADDERAVARLARACRSTASFPGAFEPSEVPIALYEPRHVARGLFDGALGATVPVIDGAVLVNLPASSAIEAIIGQPSGERIERVLALVVPDPAELVVADGAPPTFNQVLSKSLIGIPRTQSLTDFVRELDEHNLEVRSRRIARESLLAQFAKADPVDAWAAVDNVARALFDSYQATRVASSVALMRRGVPALLPEGQAPIDLTGLDDIDVDAIPWVADDFTPGTPAWCWGDAPVRRLAAVIITWLNEVAAHAPADVATRLYAIKQKVGAARIAADRVVPDFSVFEGMLVDELVRDSSDVAAACERACVRWPADDPISTAAAIETLNSLLGEVADLFHEFVDVMRPVVESPPLSVAASREFAALLGLVRLHDGAVTEPDGILRLLLCIEVIEATFSGTEPRSDQTIRLVQFTSQGAATIDPLQRTTPVDKLAGVELAHFGAFLKRSWRANDWMWGRIDAAERLVRLVDSLAGHRLTQAGALDNHIRAAQAAVLRQELPTVLAEIEADGGLGARSTAEGKAFCAAVRKMVNTPSGPVDLSALSEQQLQDLLAVQLVGLEDLGMEVGSNLATLTSISALATAAGILRVNGPRIIRVPVRLFGGTVAVAWRVAQRRPVGQFRAIVAVLGVAAIVTMGLVGLVGTLVDVFSDGDLGDFRYASWILLVLSIVLITIAVPWLLVVIARRVLSRQSQR